MAVAHVQSEGIISVGSVASINLTLNADVVAGNLLVAGGCFENEALTVTVSSTPSNTWNQLSGSPLDDPSANLASGTMHYAMDVAAGSTTITYDPSANDFCAFAVAEYSGCHKTTQPNASDTETGNSGTPTTGNVVTTERSVLVGVLTRGFSSAETISTGASFNQRFENEDDSNSMAMHFEDRIDLAPGTYQATWTLQTARDFVALAAAFGEAPTGAPPNTTYVVRHPIF